MKYIDLINGFLGLLNTLGTLLDRSSTIKHIFKKSQQTPIAWNTPGVRPASRITRFVFSDFGRLENRYAHLCEMLYIYLYVLHLVQWWRKVLKICGFFNDSSERPQTDVLNVIKDLN